MSETVFPKTLLVCSDKNFYNCQHEVGDIIGLLKYKNIISDEYFSKSDIFGFICLSDFLHIYNVECNADNDLFKEHVLMKAYEEFGGFGHFTKKEWKEYKQMFERFTAKDE